MKLNPRPAKKRPPKTVHPATKKLSSLEGWVKSRLPEGFGEFEISFERVGATAAAPRNSTRVLCQAGMKAAITHRFEGRTRRLELWVSDAADWGAWNYDHEGADESVRDPIPFEAESVPSAGEGRWTVLRYFERIFSQFLKIEVLLPALESWLGRHGIEHRAFLADFFSSLDHEDEENWSFRELIFPRVESFCEFLDGDEEIEPDYSTCRVLGVTGDGRAGLFRYSREQFDPRFVDFVNCEIQTDGILSGGALASWLNGHAKRITANF